MIAGLALSLGSLVTLALSGSNAQLVRACADGDAFCRVLAPDAFAADDLPYWMERAYLNPQTTIGPDESEYIHITVLTFA